MRKMENDSQESKRGILKKDLKQNDPTGKSGGVTWDEENILETFHPPNKDYGHMKIAEPPTPFESASESENSSLSGHQNHDDQDFDGGPKKIIFVPDENVESKLNTKDSEAHRKFEEARKKHYDEFTKVQLARKLMEEEMKDLDEEE